MHIAITKNERCVHTPTLNNLSDLQLGKKQTISAKYIKNGFILFLTVYVSKEVFKNR